MQAEKTITICDHCKSETNHKCGVCGKDVCCQHLRKRGNMDFSGSEYISYNETIMICYKCKNTASETEIMDMLKYLKHESEAIRKELVSETFYKRIKERNDNKFSRKKFLNDLFKSKTLL